MEVSREQILEGSQILVGRAEQAQAASKAAQQAGMVATEGWAEVSDVSMVDMARRFEDAGVAAIIYTDISRDGMLKGINWDATIALADAYEGIAPGQACVVYAGDRVLGGGWITGE